MDNVHHVKNKQLHFLKRSGKSQLSATLKPFPFSIELKNVLTDEVDIGGGFLEAFPLLGPSVPDC